MKKIMTVLFALAFVGASLIFVSGCAKKQMQVSEGVQPTVQETKPAEESVSESTKAAAEEARQKAAAEAEAARRAEAERQAKLKAVEEAQRALDQKNAFEDERIHFAFDKADLTSESQMILKKKADWLNQHPEYSVRIEGNCDERGTAEYNLALGQRRASAAEKFLATLGIAENRLSTVSYGEERPIDPAHNEAAWALNRRDDFKLIK
ncbi:MAG: peptidoglycan-associated lipoprotein Pal [Desulfatiglandaceae bacterium]|jgi:peptidoglycan-associated lipoprotein